MRFDYGLDLAAWTIEIAGVRYCTSFCANASGALDHHDDEGEQPRETAP